jgi:predicted amidohydrolase
MKVAVFQFSPTPGVMEPNLATILNGVDRAAQAGADLFVAPEMSLTGWTLRDAWVRAELAIAVHETALPALERAANLWRIGIVVGGPGALDSSTSGRGPAPILANTVFGLGPDGSRTLYHKIHLFEQERDWWEAGDATAVAEFGGVRVGLTICYDAEFPEVPRMTRLAGADLLVVPTTNMTPYAPDQDLIFATRALENEFPVVVANRVGSENGWTYFGRSLITDRRGRIIAQAGSAEQLLIADVELSQPGDPALSYLGRRRPEVYGPLVKVHTHLPGPVSRLPESEIG